jgi:hypothetical protein
MLTTLLSEVLLRRLPLTNTVYSVHHHAVKNFLAPCEPDGLEIAHLQILPSALLLEEADRLAVGHSRQKAL